ncbi:MAG TPA: NusA-like transcription termination signal-binding factor [archaeon]|nr:NusA-like transcription termination signal-binding factor [archaeon]
MKLLDISQIQMMNALDAIAKVSARDCFVEGDSVVFLIPEKDMNRAIGKSGSTVELLKKRIGKRVELFEYTEQPEKFFERAFFKAKIVKVEIKDMKDSKIAIVSVDATNKKIILQNMRRLKRVKELAKRNYGIEEVRIR